MGTILKQNGLIYVGLIRALGRDPEFRGDYPRLRPPLHFRRRYSVPTFLLCQHQLTFLLNHEIAFVNIRSNTHLGTA